MRHSEFRGRFFDGQTSRPREVAISHSPNPPEIHLTGEDLDTVFLLQETTLHPPLADDPIRLDFANGSSLEIDGGTVVYKEIRDQFRSNFFEEFADRLERHWKGTFVTLCALILLGWMAFQFGIPWAAERIAMSLSPTVIDAVSSDSAEFLEKRIFETSELPLERQIEIREAFDQLLLDNQIDPGGYSLLFRKSAELGANAFALPSGTIYLLDDLVELADNDAQVVAVLSHESAHVVKRHGIQGVLRSTGVYAIFSTLIGDVTSLSALATALPTMLVDAGYSREFETEADLYGAELLLTEGRDPEDLNVMLLRLSADHSVSLTPEVLASHPASARRVEAVRAFVRSRATP
jgi:Zn-dependent protease with chaperone function